MQPIPVHKFPNTRSQAPAPVTVQPTVVPGAARRSQGQRLRRFVFTLNNYTDDEVNWLKNTFPESPQKPTWMIFGKETGEEGTPHLQGAVCLGRQVSFSTVKTWPGFRRAHIDSMRGSVDDSVRYCSKQDLNPFEVGTRPSPGKRSDLDAVALAIQEGSSMSKIAEDYAVAFIKYHRGLTALRNARIPQRDPRRGPTCYWLHGPTGIGKTKCAWEFAVAYGGPESVWISSGGTKWFDGYDAQDIAIFDDIRGKDIKFNFLLRLTDRYPLRCEIKGGYVEWIPKVIIFTCPYSIADCFSTRATHKPEDIRQLERRIERSFNFSDAEDLAAFTSLYEPPPDAAGGNDGDGLGTGDRELSFEEY